jgi:hypothetical protein
MKTLIITLILILTAGYGCAGTVTLEWDAYTDLADGFNVYVSNSPNVVVAPVNKVATITPSTATQVTFTTSNGLKYFVATAYQGEYESVPSNEISGVVTPNKPLNLRAK